jgi:magnesium-transporting ATPase (P-type)
MELVTSELLHGEVIVLTDERKKELYGIFTQYASDGKRVLAMAYRDFQKNTEEIIHNASGGVSLEIAESDLVFVGFTAMMDPPRPEVAPAIQECQEAGIRVIMITGDSELTAGAVGQMIGLSGETIDATQLSIMSDEELSEKLTHVSIFSRIAPQDKLRIIRLLKAQ